MVEVSDNKFNYNNIIYINNQIGDTVARLGGGLKLVGDERSHLYIDCDGASFGYLFPLLIDKIGDVIAVNYKYGYFKKNIRTAGLNQLEYELLLNALISADIEEDKRFIRSRLRGNSSYCIDGDFNFKMKALKEKWAEIVGYIPPTFTRTELKEFISYLVGEKTKNRVYIDKHNVYDRHFNRLNRTFLVENGDKANIVKEVILSASGQVELCEKLDELNEFYLKEFFGDKIFFGSGYFS
ncbi:MAG: hypothetical protein ACI4M6_03880 [Christensenellaceae bacterium]